MHDVCRFKSFDLLQLRVRITGLTELDVRYRKVLDRHGDRERRGERPVSLLVQAKRWDALYEAWDGEVADAACGWCAGYLGRTVGLSARAKARRSRSRTWAASLLGSAVARKATHISCVEPRTLGGSAPAPPSPCRRTRRTPAPNQ